MKEVDLNKELYSKSNPENNVSFKDAIQYAIDVIYALNDRLEEPLENPFTIIDDLPKELFLRKFEDYE